MEEAIEDEVDEDLHRDVCSLRAVLEEDAWPADGAPGPSWLHSETVSSGEDSHQQEGEVQAVTDLRNLLTKNLELQAVLTKQLQQVDRLLAANRSKLSKVMDTQHLKKWNFNLRRFKSASYFRDHKDECPPGSASSRPSVQTNFYCVRDSLWRSDKDEKLKVNVKRQATENILIPFQQKLKSGSEEEKQMVKKKMKDVQKLNDKQLLADTSDIDWDMLAYETFNSAKTASDCQLHWDNLLAPSINRSPWSKAEDKKLLKLAQQHKCVDWVSIAKELNSSRTAFACLERYQKSLNPTLLKSAWSPEDDKILREACSKYGLKNWGAVSVYVGGNRTSQQCLHRWYNTLQPGIRKGRWSQHETEQLRLAVERHGAKNWPMIAAAVPGRTPVQCRERWVNVLDSKVNRGPWTPEEDVKLIEYCQEYQTGVIRWSQIAKRFGNRTDCMCLKRWKQLSSEEDLTSYYTRRVKSKEEIMSNFQGRRKHRPSLSGNDLEDDTLSQETQQKVQEYRVKVQKKKLRAAGLLPGGRVKCNRMLQNLYAISAPLAAATPQETATANRRVSVTKHGRASQSSVSKKKRGSGGVVVDYERYGDIKRARWEAKRKAKARKAREELAHGKSSRGRGAVTIGRYNLRRTGGASISETSPVDEQTDDSSALNSPIYVSDDSDSDECSTAAATHLTTSIPPYATSFAGTVADALNAVAATDRVPGSVAGPLASQASVSPRPPPVSHAVSELAKASARAAANCPPGSVAALLANQASLSPPLALPGSAMASALSSATGSDGPLSTASALLAGTTVTALANNPAFISAAAGLLSAISSAPSPPATKTSTGTAAISSGAMSAATPLPATSELFPSGRSVVIPHSVQGPCSTGALQFPRGSSIVVPSSVLGDQFPSGRSVVVPQSMAAAHFQHGVPVDVPYGRPSFTEPAVTTSFGFQSDTVVFSSPRGAFASASYATDPSSTANQGQATVVGRAASSATVHDRRATTEDPTMYDLSSAYLQKYAERLWGSSGDQYGSEDIHPRETTSARSSVGTATPKLSSEGISVGSYAGRATHQPSSSNSDENPISVAVQVLLDLNSVPMDSTSSGIFSDSQTYSFEPLSYSPRYTMSPVSDASSTDVVDSCSRPLPSTSQCPGVGLSPVHSPLRRGSPRSHVSTSQENQCHPLVCDRQAPSLSLPCLVSSHLVSSTDVVARSDMAAVAGVPSSQVSSTSSLPVPGFSSSQTHPQPNGAVPHRVLLTPTSDSSTPILRTTSSRSQVSSLPALRPPVSDTTGQFHVRTSFPPQFRNIAIFPGNDQPHATAPHIPEVSSGPLSFSASPPFHLHSLPSCTSGHASITSTRSPYYILGVTHSIQSDHSRAATFTTALSQPSLGTAAFPILVDTGVPRSIAAACQPRYLGLVPPPSPLQYSHRAPSSGNSLQVSKFPRVVSGAERQASQPGSHTGLQESSDGRTVSGEVVFEQSEEVRINRVEVPSTTAQSASRHADPEQPATTSSPKTSPVAEKAQTPKQRRSMPSRSRVVKSKDTRKEVVSSACEAISDKPSATVSERTEFEKQTDRVSTKQTEVILCDPVVLADQPQDSPDVSTQRVVAVTTGNQPTSQHALVVSAEKTSENTVKSPTHPVSKTQGSSQVAQVDLMQDDTGTSHRASVVSTEKHANTIKSPALSVLKTQGSSRKLASTGKPSVTVRAPRKRRRPLSGLDYGPRKKKAKHRRSEPPSITDTGKSGDSMAQSLSRPASGHREHHSSPCPDPPVITDRDQPVTTVGKGSFRTLTGSHQVAPSQGPVAGELGMPTSSPEPGARGQGEPIGSQATEAVGSASVDRHQNSASCGPVTDGQLVSNAAPDNTQALSTSKTVSSRAGVEGRLSVEQAT